MQVRHHIKTLTYQSYLAYGFIIDHRERTVNYPTALISSFPEKVNATTTEFVLMSHHWFILINQIPYQNETGISHHNMSHPEKTLKTKSEMLKASIVSKTSTWLSYVVLLLCEMYIFTMVTDIHIHWSDSLFMECGSLVTLSCSAPSQNIDRSHCCSLIQRFITESRCQSKFVHINHVETFLKSTHGAETLGFLHWLDTSGSRQYKRQHSTVRKAALMTSIQIFGLSILKPYYYGKSFVESSVAVHQYFVNLFTCLWKQLSE
jgi:hypothetical protein